MTHSIKWGFNTDTIELEYHHLNNEWTFHQLDIVIGTLNITESIPVELVLPHSPHPAIVNPSPSERLTSKYNRHPRQIGIKGEYYRGFDHPAPLTSTICAYYLKNCCRYGSNCMNLHTK